MDKLLIARFAFSHMGVFGRIQGTELFTVERPWLDNRSNVSCIPNGEYPLKRCRYNKGGYDSFEILDVPGRSEIKFHVANTMDHVEGCIGVGAHLGALGNKWAVLNSRYGFNLFMEFMERKRFVTVVFYQEESGR